MTLSEFLAHHAMEVMLLPLLLLGAAFFNAGETAMFSLTRAQIQHLGTGGRAARLAASLIARPRRLLNLILLGNMFVTVLYGSIWAVLLLDVGDVGLPAWAAAAMSLAPVLLLILIGEITPKSIGLRAGERMAVLLAGPLAAAAKVAGPLLWVLETLFVQPLTRMIQPQRSPDATITAGELAGLLDLSAKRSGLNLQANALLQEIMSMKDIRAGDIMVPRVDMVAVDVHAERPDVADAFRRSRLRRLPVYDGDLDRILGVVHAKDFLLNPQSPLEKLVVKAPFVPKAANIERVLLQFRVTGTQLAIVVDEYGGTAGLVALEDVLEEIIGDIPDPDRITQPLVERISQDEYLVHGELGIHELAEALDTRLPGRRVSTVGGLVMSLLGRVPKAGDVVVYRNLRFTVQSMHRRRVDELRLELLEAKA